MIYIFIIFLFAVTYETTTTFNVLRKFTAFLPKVSVISLCYSASLLLCNTSFSLAPGGVLPNKRLLRMCRWMGSHFHNWTDYNGVTFLVELLEWGRKFSGFLGKKTLVSKDLKI